MGDINPKQQIFIDHYTDPSQPTFFNASKSAIAAGYSKRTARVQGCTLLTKPNIATAVEKKMTAALEKTGMLTANWLNKIKMLVDSDMRNLAEWGPDGVKFKDSSELSDEDAYSVSEVSQTITREGGTIRVKTVPKERALDMLGKFLAIYTENRTIHTPESAIANMSQRERDARLAELLSKRSEKGEES